MSLFLQYFSQYFLSYYYSLNLPFSLISIQSIVFDFLLRRQRNSFFHVLIATRIMCEFSKYRIVVIFGTSVIPSRCRRHYQYCNHCDEHIEGTGLRDYQTGSFSTHDCSSEGTSRLPGILDFRLKADTAS